MGKGAVVSESLTSFESVSYFNTPSRLRHVFARSPLASSFCRASAWQRLTLTRFVSLTTSIFTAPRWASRLSCQSTCSAPVVPIHKFGGDQTAPDLRSTEGWRRVHPELAKASRRRLAPRLPRST